jgi:glycosyltransferase involved in cell wall biosynthesis
MKIGIVGTRGIPNRYGGFEQCAQEIAPRIVAAGHEVIVFNPKSHEYQDPTYKGVKIARVEWDEKRNGKFGVFKYDWLSLHGAMQSEVDVVLILGHTPVGLFVPKRSNRNYAVVTNMDGVERKRSKFSWAAKKLLIVSENLAARRSDILIADNIGIQAYIQNQFNRESLCIEYGAAIPPIINSNLLSNLGASPGSYALVIARLEPENNLQMIISGMANKAMPLLIVGSLNTPYARTLLRDCRKLNNVRFLDAIYDPDLLNALRYNAAIYFHGHSVGGTNPALLEAMAAQARIAAHDNEFNRSVLEGSAYFFRNGDDIAYRVARLNGEWPVEWREKNLHRIQTHYNWDRIAELYIEALESAIKLPRFLA